MKKFSIIIPVYFNELNLNDSIPKLLDLKKNLVDYELELIFVDDGSKDKSLEILRKFQAKYPNEIIVIKLTRNFGSMSAVQAGFTKASGDCMGVISADLQDPPELFLEMIKYWEKGIKAVYAIRNKRKDSFSDIILARIYYAFIRRFAMKDYPKGGFDFVIVDKEVVQEINNIKEKNTNLLALIFWLGYEYVTIPYTRRERKKGKSKWTINKKLKLFVDSFVAFSYFPIRILSILGIIFAVGAFAYGIFIFSSWAQGLIQVEGWTTTMIVLTFTAGIQMTMLGILGEYLWRTLDESRKRPNFVIEKIFESDKVED